MNILRWRPLVLFLLLGLPGRFRAAAACVPPPAGSLAWWRGDSVADSTGTIGGTFRAAGKSGVGYAGSGFVFGGAHDALALPPSFKLSSQEFSVETWIKRGEAARSGLDAEGSQLFAGSANGFSFGITHQGRLYLSHIGVVNFFSTTSITDTNWHHVAVTREGSNLRFYADGILATTGACSVVFDLNGPFAIGGLGTPFAGVSYGFLGSIDELAVYGRALAETEITALANAGGAGKCAGPTRLVSLPVVNPSFEALTGADPAHFDATGHLLDNHYSAFNFATPTGFNTADALPGWSGTGAAGTFNPPSNLFPGGVTDGQNTAWINVQGHLRQTLADTFQPGRVYQLSVDVGAPAGLQFPGYVIGLYANGQAVAEDNNTKNIAAGSFATATVTAALAAGSPAVGAPIEIRLGIPSFKPDQTDFDNVRLTVESPIVENLALTASAPATAQPNTDFTVTFTVENQGNQAATGVVLATPLPVGFVLVTNTASQGASAGAGGTLVTVLGTLPGGSNATVTVTGHGSVPGNLVFHGKVTREGSEELLTDNERDTGVEVLGPCVPAPAGLVAWLRAEGDTTDELQHTTSSAGALRYAAGRAGHAFDLDGASEIVIADSPELNQSNFTLESWVYPTTVDGTVDIIANKETSYPNLLTDIQFELGIKGPLNDAPSTIPVGNLAFFLSGISGLPNNYGGWTDAKAAIPLNQWTHVALTVTPGTVTAYVNGAVALSVTGLTGSPVMNNWPLKIGSRSTIYVTQTRPQDRFNGRIDEFSFYARALSAAEITSAFQAGASGKCVQPFPVAIVAQPANTTVLAGTDATFSVAATGSKPLSYQWQFKGTNIEGATNAQLVVVGARKPAAGEYRVTVCNPLGCANSDPATLTATPVAALVQVRNSPVKSTESVTVPVNLVGNGDENAVSFSLRYNPQLLTFEGLAAGQDAGGAQILANTSATANGYVGVAIALPAGTTFPEGTNQLLNLTFRAALTNAARTSALQFGDNPSERELADASAKPLEVVWANGAVSIAPADYEGDVGPRPNGDRRLAVADWVQVGRFVAALDEPSTATTEFQRADCAPLSTFGNGLLTVSDWVQAGRFAVGLDAAVQAAGPLAPPPVTPPNGAGVVRHGLPERIVRMTGIDFLAGKTGQVAVVMAASGEENALAFSVQFDPAVLRFVGATAGTGAGSATFNLNGKLAAAGRVGLAFALPVPNKFAAGDRELARLQFVPASGDPGPTGLAFADAPVVREVASPAAEVLPSGWQAAAIAVVTPSLGVNRVETALGTSIELSWPAALTGASLQSSGDTLSGSWKLVPGLVTIRDGRNVLTVPAGSTAGFFRLSLP